MWFFTLVFGLWLLGMTIMCSKEDRGIGVVMYFATMSAVYFGILGYLL